MTRYLVSRRTALTERQVEVLRHVAAGMTNAKIGEALHLSEESVKRHVRELRYHLGARDRAHAVDLGWRMGYLGGRPVSEVRDR